MKTWDDWSDFEINRSITKCLGVEVPEVDGNWYVADGNCIYKTDPNGGINRTRITNDYCNNPADTWPIIVDNNMWVQPDMVGDGFWHVYDRDDSYSYKSYNPLRAAAIVFLMMNGATPNAN